MFQTKFLSNSKKFKKKYLKRTILISTIYKYAFQLVLIKILLCKCIQQFVLNFIEFYVVFININKLKCLEQNFQVIWWSLKNVFKSYCIMLISTICIINIKLMQNIIYHLPFTLSPIQLQILRSQRHLVLLYSGLKKYE